MPAHDGIIPYDLAFTETDAVEPSWIEELNCWRTILIRHGVLGQDPDRYGGYGFGNVSRRLPPWDAPPTQRRFLVSGSQTGHLPVLGPEHFAVVTECFPVENRLVALGRTPPSSESLTHGSLYAVDDAIRSVMHVHAPELWQDAHRLGIPITDPSVPYGSPGLAREIAHLFVASDLPARRILAMGGHEDGLVVFGESVDQAGETLIAALRSTRQ